MWNEKPDVYEEETTSYGVQRQIHLDSYAYSARVECVQTYRVGQKKVSLIIFAIALSTASQFS